MIHHCGQSKLSHDCVSVCVFTKMIIPKCIYLAFGSMFGQCTEKISFTHIHKAEKCIPTDKKKPQNTDFHNKKNPAIQKKKISRNDRYVIWNWSASQQTRWNGFVVCFCSLSPRSERVYVNENWMVPITKISIEWNWFTSQSPNRKIVKYFHIFTICH